MAISINFKRPKLETTLDEVVPITATLVENTTDKLYIIDTKYTVTKDDASTVTKVIKRFKINPVIAGTTIRFDITEITFPPTAPDNPTDDQGTISTPIRGASLVDLDTFLTAVGDVRKNS
jgi:hypothetical protein